MVCFSMKVASPCNGLLANRVIRTFYKMAESLEVVNWILLCLSWAVFLIVELGNRFLFFFLASLPVVFSLSSSSPLHQGGPFLHQDGRQRTSLYGYLPVSWKSE